MTMQSVLVLLTEPRGARILLDAAATAARALGEPRIDVLHVRLDPASTILPSEEVLTPEHVRAVEGAAATEGAKVYAEFEAWCAAGHAGQWQEVVGVPADEVRRRGADAALVAMTLPAPHPPSAEQAALEAALFGTGRPVLAVPAGGKAASAATWRSAGATRRQHGRR